MLLRVVQLGIMEVFQKEQEVKMGKVGYLYLLLSTAASEEVFLTNEALICTNGIYSSVC